MNAIARIKQTLARPFARKGNDLTPEALWALMSGTGYARSGALVGWYNALCVTAVLACVRVVAEDIAKVDLRLELANGLEVNPAVDHPLYDLLAYAPNGWQTSFEFREMITAFAMLKGDGIAYVTRSAIDGRPLELIPIPPPWVYINRPVGTWDLQYTISFPNGSGTVTVGAKNIMHLRGPSVDGVVGMDIIRMAREAVGLAMSGEEHQAKLASGSLKSAGYLTSPNPLTDKQIDQIKTVLKENYGGVRNADKTPVFQNGLEYKELGVSGKNAEILATRKFQVEEIARAFRVFPQMIGDTVNTSTHGGATEFFSAHVVHTLQPWASRWEQVIRRDLLTPAEAKAGYRAKFMLDDLLRGDPAARGEFYKDLAQCGAITPNEIRRKEGLNPLPGLDIPLRPINMTPENEDQEDNNSTPPPKKPAETNDGEDENDNTEND